MGEISEKVEARIQKELPRSTSVVIDQGVLYTNIHFFRYVEGNRHITGDCDYRFVNPDQYWMPWLIRELFARKVFILKLETPVRWDNEETSISATEVKQLVSRIDLALRKKYKRHKIEFVESTNKIGR